MSAPAPGPADARARLRRAGETMARQGLVWGTAGNISLRTGDDGLLISASGTRLGELADGDLVACSLTGGGRPDGARASKELPMHQAVYQARPEIGAVLHGSPMYGTLAACSNLPLPSELFVESMVYLARMARVPYRHPGSVALAQTVGARAAGADVLLLENHGVLVYAEDIDRALAALETLEFTCRMLVTARRSGLELRLLPTETVADFRDRVSYGPRPGGGA